jgi:hypothetical protein
MNNKQTAVQWLVEKLSYSTSNSTIISHHFIITELVEQAKQMEKEQIDNFIDFINERHFNQFRISKDEAELFYNETYQTK